MDDDELYDDGAWDNFELDEEALRQLEKIEQDFNNSKVLQSQSSQHPPPKKQRIDPPKPPPKVQPPARRQQLDDDDDDITITLDESGNYGLLNSLQQQPQRTVPPAPPTPANLQQRPQPQLAPTQQQQPKQLPSRRPNVQPPRPPQLHQPTPSTSYTHIRPPQQQQQQPSLPVQKPPIPPPVVPHKRNSSPGPSAVELELQEMRAQLAKLQSSNIELESSYERLNTELQAAEKAKYSHQGEISNLRRSIEHTRAKHTADLERILSEKAEVEKSKSELQKTMKEELERLRTGFIIRQQEIETSTRKMQLGSVRRPSGMSQAHGGFTQHTPISAHRNTQRPSIFNGIVHDTPAPAARKARERPLPQPDFAGFVNSFAPSSPVKSPTKRKAKFAPPPPPPRFDDRSSSPGPELTQGMGSGQQTPVRKIQRTASQSHVHDTDGMFFSSSPGGDAAMDVELADVPTEEDEEQLDFTSLQISQPEEIRQVVVSHWKGDSGILSLQILLGADQSREYATACLGLVGQGNCAQVGTALVNMARHLAVQVEKHKLALSTLLDLATFLVYAFPAMAPSFLSRTGVPQGELPLMLQVLDTISPALGADVLAFLEGLCWQTRDDHHHTMAQLLRRPRFLSTVMSQDLPAALRFLVVVASAPGTHEALLSFPDRASTEASPPDMRRIPLIERLSAVINSEVDDLKEMHVAALTCVAQIALAHESARMLLLESASIVTALISVTWNIVSRLWDGGSAHLPSVSLRVLQHAVHLLHHLGLARGPTDDMRDRLTNGVGGLDYMFTVSIGRLAYADPPETLSSETRDGTKKLIEFARDLLELVVDGPEMDDIYNAYQWDDSPAAGKESGSLQQDEDAFMDDG